MELREELLSSTSSSFDIVSDLAVPGAFTLPHTYINADPNNMWNETSEINQKDTDSTMFSDSGGGGVLECDNPSMMMNSGDSFIHQSAEKGIGEDNSSISASSLPHSGMCDSQKILDFTNNRQLTGDMYSLPVSEDTLYVQLQEDQHLSQINDSTFRKEFRFLEQEPGIVETGHHFSEKGDGDIVAIGITPPFPSHTQEAIDTILVSEMSTECTAEMNEPGIGMSQPNRSIESESFSNRKVVCDFDTYEEEAAGPVSNRALLPDVDSCVDSTVSQQEQTLDFFSPVKSEIPLQNIDIATTVNSESVTSDEPVVPRISSIVESTVHRELYVPESVSTEGMPCEDPSTQAEQLTIISVTSQGTALQTKDVVSVSPSADFGAHSQPVSETMDCSAFPCIVNVQTVSDLTPCALGDKTEDEIATGVIEDGIPTTISVIPSETSQGLYISASAESGLSVEDDSASHKISEERQLDSNTAAEGPFIQSVHSLSLDQMESLDQGSYPSISDSDTTFVITKEEPPDAGYEHVQTDSGQKPPVNMNQGTQSAKTAEGPKATTTVVKQGKKRVKITIIKGEWRKPKNKSKNKNVMKTAGQDIRPNTIQQIPQPNATLRNEVANSAFPTALFRNAHMIKTEPVDEDYPDSKFRVSSTQAAVPLSQNRASSQQIVHSPCISSQRTAVLSSSITTTRSKQTLETAVPSASVSVEHMLVPSSRKRRVRLQESPAPPSSSVAEASPGTSHAVVVSASLFSKKGRGRGKRREDGPASVSSISVSDVVTHDQFEPTLKKNMESPTQMCAVRLKQLPSHIVAAGMVNVKTEPQVMQMSPRQVINGVKHQTFEGPRIKVMDPLAFHPIKRRNKQGPRPWSCEFCDKTFKTASARSQHKKIHSGIKEHGCEVCGKTFTYKSTLTAHYRTHTNERPYVCSLCGAAFRWANHLTNHLGMHSHVKLFRCDQCGKEFNQKANLMTHVKRHSGIRPYKCLECDIACVTKSELASHMRTHTGEKPYRCHLCSASFAHNNTLQVHLRSHNDERPFQCHLCTAAFRQSTHRNVHIRFMHEKPQREGYKPRKPRKQVYRGPKSIACRKNTDQERVTKSTGKTSCGSAKNDKLDGLHLRTKIQRGKRKRAASSDDDDEADPDWNRRGVSKMKKQRVRTYKQKN